MIVPNSIRRLPTHVPAVALLQPGKNSMLHILHFRKPLAVKKTFSEAHLASFILIVWIIKTKKKSVDATAESIDGERKKGDQWHG